MRRITIVGASLAGLRAAETLRSRGYDGALTLVGDEPHRPYDRPPLSKQVLLGTWTPEQTFFRQKDGYDPLALDLRLGVRATSLDVGAKRVMLADGGWTDYDRLIIATGARVRTFPGIAGRPGLVVLRTLDDALVLREELAKARRVAIIGMGFIGLEVAAACRSRGVDVVAVEWLPVPLAPIIGPTLGAMLVAMHSDHGVDVRTGISVTGVYGEPRVAGLELSDGSRVDADVVVVGIGVVPNTDWLEGSGLALDNGIVCDGSGQAAPDVYAAGDVARMANAWYGGAPRIEHWTNAVEQGVHVAEQILKGTDVAARFSSVPYFWSDQYDRKIQFIGRARPHDEMLVVDGSVADRRLTALYRHADRVVACLTVNQPRALIKYRKLLATNPSWEAAVRDVTAT
jgi:NADPH-dependent 2,4-dienoyl-CoA reductase/sulfur reductase-like enzyme